MKNDCTGKDITAIDELEIREDEPTFRKDLTDIINKHSKENGSNTPDFILCEYLLGCLETFDAVTRSRAWWWRGTDSGETVPNGSPERE